MYSSRTIKYPKGTTSNQYSIFTAMPTLSQKILTVVLTVLALSIHIAASSRFGLTPAIGPLLSPFEGFWQNAEPLEQPNVPRLILAQGIGKKVVIRFDSSLVPHIEAESQADLFYAQGFVCASLRLWQMDFIARAAAGRMSEVFGTRALEYDRFQRRFGMGMAAQNSLKAMMANPDTREALQAYTEGANAYIASLDIRQMPLEFKILGYQPEMWTPLKTAYLLKYMAYSLSGHTDEVALTKARSLLGPMLFNALYPSNQAVGVPVIPAGTPFSFSPLSIPALDTSELKSIGEDLLHQADARNGSNNWAVGGAKTASGKPLLANDPHLGLQLPSLWIRMQLDAPGYKAMGMTLPGAPGLIVGHNSVLAWGVTNADADVLDLFKVTTVDQGHYLHGGKSVPFRQIVESIQINNGTVVLDTVLYTHLGPLAYTKASTRGDVPSGLAIRWAAHTESNDLACFLGLARSKNQADAENALGFMACPAQNFVYADTSGNIGMYVAGNLPLKAYEEGKFVQALSNSTSKIFKFIPFEHNPKVSNPSNCFVASANQHSTDSTYPYYLNWRHSEPARGNRIVERLRVMNHATPDSMAAVQNDNHSLVAQRFLPDMLAALDKDKMSYAEQEVVELLRNWNLRYDSDQIAPSVFERWFQALQDTVWDELGTKGFPYPQHQQLYQALNNTFISRFVDVQNTTRLETVGDVYRSSFQVTYDHLITNHGAAGKSWNWGRVKRTQLAHMAKIPGLNVPFVSVSGGKYEVNATSQTHGPSMRMVVDLSSPIKAYGNMPGGQSGNPGSPFYLTELEEWRKGKLIPWLEYERGSKKREKVLMVWQIQP